MANSFSKGDLVGIKIDKVDRTNCDAKVMPCLIDERINQNTSPMFRLLSPFGRLSTLFPVHHLSKLTSSIPQSLHQIQRSDAPTVTYVHACKMFARSCVASTCDCKSKCLTKTCPCRRASIACSTKCHARRGKCGNADWNCSVWIERIGFHSRTVPVSISSCKKLSFECEKSRLIRIVVSHLLHHATEIDCKTLCFISTGHLIAIQYRLLSDLAVSVFFSLFFSLSQYSILFLSICISAIISLSIRPSHSGSKNSNEHSHHSFILHSVTLHLV